MNLNEDVKDYQVFRNNTMVKQADTMEEALNHFQPQTGDAWRIERKGDIVKETCNESNQKQSING